MVEGWGLDNGVSRLADGQLAGRILAGVSGVSGLIDGVGYGKPERPFRCCRLSV